MNVSVELYAGDDLINAAARSYTNLDPPTPRQPATIARIWRDVRNATWRTLIPSRQWVKGRQGSELQEALILFAGSLRVLSYYSDRLFGIRSWDRVSEINRTSRTADIVVLDHPFFRRPPRSSLRIQSPPWVRLERSLAGDWESTLKLVPSKQLKRVTRHLRRFGYTAECHSGMDAIRSFRNDLLVPAMERRFGKAAILASEDSFLDECRNMIRLDLMSGGSVVASNLLSFHGTRLSIAKGTSALGYSDLKGRMDVLDYFTLLIAQLTGKSVLDFGLCRANLDDGPLRYKAKWGATLVPAGGLKANTLISVQRDNPSTRSILRCNRFLELDDDGFSLKILADTAECKRGLPSLVARAAAAGVVRIDLFEADSKTADELASTYRIKVNAIPFKPG